jgi:flagellar biosynthesis protein FlhB
VARSSADATEEPTPRRLAEARRRGEIAFSRELSSSAALLATVVVLSMNGPVVAARAVAALRAGLALAVAAPGPSGGVDVGAAAALGAAATLALRMLAPALGAAVLVALVVGLAQTRGLVLAPVRVDLARLASAGAWRRLFDGKAALTAAQGLLKVAVVAAVAWLALRPVVGAVVGLPGAGAPRLLAVLGITTERLAVRLAAAALVLGVADALLVERRHRRGLRMTREEVKREHKEAEGDPAHRGERQRLHREIAEQRMLEEVRKADFVVVNPDHIAVALRYDANGDAAPVVVAKGERLVAERIKQVAREAGVPIFREVGLARSLAELGEGGEIPVELYEAVAAILRVVQGLDAPPGPSAATRAEAPAPTRGRGADWKRV